MQDARATLAALLELTRDLTGQVTLERALSWVVRTTLQLVPGTHCSIRLLDADRNELLCGARAGAGTEHEPVTFRPGQGVVGWVIEHGEVARINDTSTDDRFDPRPDQGLQIQSLLVVPLMSGGKIIGALAVVSPDKDVYGEDDEFLLRLLANCAVPPVERARLERLALTDHHTRAYNQRYLFPRLREEVARAGRFSEPLTVLLLDLDHFKRVNDTHGHAAGDLVLRTFADRVRAQVRAMDVLVRRGGEEFVLIMPNTSGEAAAVVAERIRMSVADEPMQLTDGGSLDQTVSIGIAAWAPPDDAEALEARADRAMYEAKHGGRNRVEHAPPTVTGHAGHD